MHMLDSTKIKLWKAALSISPLPTLARARASQFWQRHWREKQQEGNFPNYAAGTPLKRWFARQITNLAPSSVLELGCNVGGNLRAIADLDPSVALYGIELNDRAIAWGEQNVLPASAKIFGGSMADTLSLTSKHGIDGVDVVFTSAAAMHCDDKIFAAAKNAALSIGRKAIVHLEFNAWTPADLHNGRAWRESFLSDRWIRDYVGEYEGHPRVAKIEVSGVPLKVNFMDSIGRVMISDVSGLIVVHLNSPV
jgi:SAM-dependent methyltransferase